MYHWIKIFGSLEEAENLLQLNKTMAFDLKGKKICVTRTKNGLFAVQDKCPHNGALFSKGGICQKNQEIVCPLHRYSFDLKSGKCTSGQGYALDTFPLEEKNDGLYIGIKARWWER
ncbi:MAG: Rieske (2Fe-2S) protein [Bacteroidia bacterium]